MIAVEKLIVFWPMWLSLQCARVMMRSGRAMIVWIMRGTCSYIIILFTTSAITRKYDIDSVDSKGCDDVESIDNSRI